LGVGKSITRVIQQKGERWLHICHAKQCRFNIMCWSRNILQRRGCHILTR